MLVCALNHHRPFRRVWWWVCSNYFFTLFVPVSCGSCSPIMAAKACANRSIDGPLRPEVPQIRPIFLPSVAHSSQVKFLFGTHRVCLESCLLTCTRQDQRFSTLLFMNVNASLASCSLLSTFFAIFLWLQQWPEAGAKRFDDHPSIPVRFLNGVKCLIPCNMPLSWSASVIF